MNLKQGFPATDGQMRKVQEKKRGGVVVVVVVSLKSTNLDDAEKRGSDNLFIKQTILINYQWVFRCAAHLWRSGLSVRAGAVCSLIKPPPPCGLVSVILVGTPPCGLASIILVGVHHLHHLALGVGT